MRMIQIDVSREVAAYLKRIDYHGPLDASIDTLAQLQSCHLHTVPYENFDILNGIPLSLEIPDLYDKVILRRRGGYCFELNALFSWLLTELGFSVTDYFARFWRNTSITPPKRRHHVIQVEVEGKRYLCDVGVGGIVPRTPIEMVEHLVHKQGDEYYQFKCDEDFGWVLYEKKREQWIQIYSFTEESQLPTDYITASYWCENAPDSIFNKGAMVSIRTDEGRNSIAGNEFRIFTTEGVQSFIPETPEEYAKALQTHFGIVLDS